MTPPRSFLASYHQMAAVAVTWLAKAVSQSFVTLGWKGYACMHEPE